MTAPLRSVYVYYRVPRGAEAASRSAVGRMFRLVATRISGEPRLLRRPGPPADTWLEVYQTREPDHLLAELDRAAARTGLAESIRRSRRHEVFEPCA